MGKNVNLNDYRRRLKKAIEEAKLRTNITDVYESLGVSRGNVSGFLNGADNRLSVETIELLIKKLEDPNSTVTNQQKIAISTPRKAASMMSNAFIEIADIKPSSGKKEEITKGVESWLRTVEDQKK